MEVPLHTPKIDVSHGFVSQKDSYVYDVGITEWLMYEFVVLIAFKTKSHIRHI